MINIKNIQEEMAKGSTGCFRDQRENIFYLLNGKFHRLDGPAVEWSDGYKWWYFKGNLHKVDGPAIENPNGTKSWYYYGYTPESEKEFYDPQWRKMIEIKVFI